MDELIPRLIATILSVSIFTTLLKVTGWNKKIWNLINNIIKPQYNIFIWILMIVILNLLIEVLIEINDLTYAEIIRGIVLGFTFAFMPNLTINKSK